MESVNKLLNMEVQAPAAFLEGLIALQVLGGISFMICSFVVAHTENIGFNVVLSGLLNLVFALASYYSLGKLKTPIIIGGVIGGGIMMSFSSFMTGVYWAQLSLCEAVTASIRHYSCDQKVAYRVTSFFSIIMFLLQLAFTTFLVYSRDEILKEYNEYEEISVYPNEAGTGNGSGYDHISSQIKINSSGPQMASADL